MTQLHLSYQKPEAFGDLRQFWDEDVAEAAAALRRGGRLAARKVATGSFSKIRVPK